jgi:RNA polymerase sigma factor (TIGR02999 family)
MGAEGRHESGGCALETRPNSPAGDVTRLLDAAAAGSSAALGEVLPLVYEELRGLAAAYLVGERAGHTLQPTALVHEAYLRLAAQRSAGWHGRAQFLGVAAQAMRRVLVDHARTRGRVKRGGGAQRTGLDEAVESLEASAGDLLTLDEALARLAAIDPQKSRVVELRFFAGASVEETAEIVGISARTVERDWAMARAWLHGEIAGKGEG